VEGLDVSDGLGLGDELGLGDGLRLGDELGVGDELGLGEELGVGNAPGDRRTPPVDTRRLGDHGVTGGRVDIAGTPGRDVPPVDGRKAGPPSGADRIAPMAWGTVHSSFAPMAR
jgi:hypothetical protein